MAWALEANVAVLQALLHAGTELPNAPGVGARVFAIWPDGSTVRVHDLDQPLAATGSDAISVEVLLNTCTESIVSPPPAHKGTVWSPPWVFAIVRFLVLAHLVVVIAQGITDILCLRCPRVCIASDDDAPKWRYAQSTRIQRSMRFRRGAIWGTSEGFGFRDGLPRR